MMFQVFNPVFFQKVLAHDGDEEEGNVGPLDVKNKGGDIPKHLNLEETPQ